jgi:hypothetical protein
MKFLNDFSVGGNTKQQPPRNLIKQPTNSHNSNHMPRQCKTYKETYLTSMNFQLLKPHTEFGAERNY